MTPEQFCYWLQGYFEVSDETRLSPKQVEIIEDHLQKVFNQDPTPTNSAIHLSDTFPIGLQNDTMV